MRSRLHVLLVVALLPFLAAPEVRAQTAALKEVHVEGLKHLTEAQVIYLSGLKTGSQVGRSDLQEAADALVRTGLFAKVTYKFDTKMEGVYLTFQTEENPLLLVSYDNFPWYDDSEIDAAIQKLLPFYDRHLPEAGEVVERAADALKQLIAAREPHADVTHQVVLSPLADGSEQQFSVVGLVPKIASVQFSDATLAEDPAVRTHLGEILNHPYSRLNIDLFLAEEIRPIYQQKGYLQAKIGPPEVRLTGDPNTQKLTDQIPVYVPCAPGAIYKWKGVDWKGNAAISTITLTNLLGMKAGEVANGQAIFGSWDRVREEYGERGYLEVKVTPTPVYDDVAHTVSYDVEVNEGIQYKYGSMTISGMSLSGEKMIHDAWTAKPGDVFNKKMFEDFLIQLESHKEKIFRDLPVHYDTVGHYLQTDPAKGTVEVLLDFK
jgi:outer membrane protein insertion porin family